VRPLTILEAGWRAWMLCRIVAPSFVTITSPFEVWICEDGDKKDAEKTLDEISQTILSIPRGPSDVRTASLIATIHYLKKYTSIRFEATCLSQRLGWTSEPPSVFPGIKTRFYETSYIDIVTRVYLVIKRLVRA